MPTTIRKVSVFMASPGDLAPEREIFRQIIARCNQLYGSLSNTQFEAVGWEDSTAETGVRVQGALNKVIDKADIFVLALHRRWGQAAADSRYSSYTEEEFHHAINLWKRKKAPLVYVFFKNVDSASEADPGPELSKVLAFRKALRETHKVLPRFFQTEADFGSEIEKHLRAYVEGTLAADSQTGFQLSTAGIEKSEKKRASQAKKLGKGEVTPKTAQKKPDLSLVQQQQSDLAMARAAVMASNAGNMEDARLLFAKATEGTTDTSILEVAADFYRKIGDIENASRIVSRQAALTKDRSIAARHYIELVPTSVLDAVEQQILNSILSSMEPEVAAEIRSINQEVYGNGRREKMLMDAMIKHYTADEIVGSAQWLASAVGQSSMQKQPMLMMEVASRYQQEFNRILLQRYPELAGQIPEAAGAPQLASAATPKS